MQVKHIPNCAVIQMRGGLGNQLFQHAFGLKLEREFGWQVSYDLQFFKRSASAPHERFWLDQLDFNIKEANKRPAGYKFARKFRRLSIATQTRLFNVAYIRNYDATYSPVPEICGLTYFDGLWQSLAYFYSLQDHILHDFRSKFISNFGKPANIRRQTVGVHVRRGDYLKHPHSVSLNYQEYIKKSLSWIKTMTGNTELHVTVFSDDPDWCAQNLNMTAVEINKSSSTLDDFLGLMHCQHKIISNSTFAWWAAFLGRVEDGFVIAPRRWHTKAEIDRSQLVCDYWTICGDEVVGAPRPTGRPPAS